MAHAESEAPSQLAASHVPAADSSSASQGLERGTRSQRWQSLSALTTQGDSWSLSGLEPPHWAPLSTVCESLTADVPDLAWLLNLNGLAQSASPASNNILQAALSQVNITADSCDRHQSVKNFYIQAGNHQDAPMSCKTLRRL